MRTLPEPTNFNLCWTGLPLNEPLRIRGEMPPARINSITIYPRGSSNPPVTLDLSSLPSPTFPQQNRMIDITLTSSPSTEPSSQPQAKTSRCGILEYPKEWNSGFIAMRNFCVPNGTRVVTPEITRIRDGKVIRHSEILVAGITSLENVDMLKIQRILILNLFISLILLSSFHLSFSQTGGVIVMGLFLSNFFYHQLYRLGKKGLSQHLTEIAPHQHEFKLPDLQKASQASQPSLDHRYWIMRYDTRTINQSGVSVGAGDDLLVQFKIQRNYQKYWSLVVYDEYGLPLPQFYNLENILHFPQNATLSSTHFDPNDTTQYFVTIRLTCSPPNPTDSALDERSNSKEENVSEPRAYGMIDIRKAQVGYVIFRIVHPTCSEVIEFSAPKLKLVSRR
jgi:hypothetical protein